MIFSMTGYGRAQKVSDAWDVDVELKSVNHRYLDIYVDLPEKLDALEEDVKQTIRRYVARGRVDVRVTVESEEKNKNEKEVDWKKVSFYVNLAEEMTNRFAVHNDLTASRLLEMEGILRSPHLDPADKKLRGILLQTVAEAAQKLQSMKQKEGQWLKKDLQRKMEAMEEIVLEIKKEAPRVISDYETRLKKRLEAYIAGTIDIEEERLLTEVAIFAEKSDIEEELTRLESHTRQFHAVLNEGGAVGKKLNFLLQEMHREAHTIGAKSSHAGVRQSVVELKSELEKMKEQVQNIE